MNNKWLVVVLALHAGCSLVVDSKLDEKGKADSGTRQYRPGPKTAAERQIN